MAIKEAITVRCDGNGCHSFEDVVDKGKRPPDWYHVRIVDAQGSTGPSPNVPSFDFCSLKCVTNWSKARSEAIGETRVRKGTRYTKDLKCPICDEMFAPQGLRMHVASTHPTENPDELIELAKLERDAKDA